MRKIIHCELWLVFASTIIFWANPCLADNLLDNPGFETGNLSDWTAWSSAGPNPQVQTAQVHDGVYALEATFPSPLTAHYSAGVYQDYPVAPGAVPNIYASIYVKSDMKNEATLSYGGLKIEFYQGSTLVGTATEARINARTGWQMLDLSKQVPAQANKIRLIAFVWGHQPENTYIQGAKVYFDDAVLSLTPIKEPFDLFNSGFENLFFDWSEGGANWQVETSASHVFKGSASARNTLISSAATQWQDLAQTRPATAGEMIRAALRVKTEFPANFPGAAGLVITFLDAGGQVITDGNGNVIEAKDQVTTASAWTQLYTEILAPGQTAQVRYQAFFWVGANAPGLQGTVWFDEARLVLPSQGAVKVEGRSLMQDSDGNGIYEPFFIKGAGYSPYPIGRYPADYGANIYDDPGILERDFSLLQAMNGNTVRIWNGNDVETYNGKWKSRITPATLDVAQAHNIKVVAGFKLGNGYDFSSLSTRTYFIERFKSFVNQFKDHPAILLWTIGNENNLTLPAAQVKPFYSLVNEMAYEARKIEGATYHPVAVVNGDLGPIGSEADEVSDRYMIDLGLWAANVYRWNSFGDLFSDFETRSDKPFWVAEFGIDAWHNGTPSYEDQATQAVWAGLLWDEIVVNSDVCVGGSLMEYSDEWWKPDVYGSHSAYHNTTTGFASPAHPDGFSNEEWYGIMAISDNGNGPDIMTPRLIYTALQEKFAVEPNYILHLGVENGIDVFPQATATASRTGAASTWMSLKYLYPSYAQTVNYLHDTYHGVGVPGDMTVNEVQFAMNTETVEPYLFNKGFYTDEDEAIRHSIFFMDYAPAGGINCPALVPKSPSFNWQVIRGFATDEKPYVGGPPFTNFTFYGMWMNDPATSGLGFNFYQTAPAYKDSYEPINGYYWCVVEPPPDFDQAEFSKAKMTIAPLRAKPALKARSGVASIDLVSSQEQLEMLKEALPGPLKSDSTFMAIFDLACGVRSFDVTDLDANHDVKLYALNLPGPQDSVVTERGFANIIIEVDPVLGAVTQAAWDPEEEAYPTISEKDAVRKAIKYLQTHSGLPPKAVANDPARSFVVEDIQFVWSKSFHVSRFHPSYQIIFTNGQVVIVNADGSIFPDSE